MARTLEYLIIVQLFFSIAITIFGFVLVGHDPGGTLSPFQNQSNAVDLNYVNSQVTGGFASQQKITTQDLGGLAYYSGSFLANLFLNFIFGLPRMIILLVGTVLVFYSMDYQIANSILLFVSILSYAIYIITVLNLVIGVGTQTGRPE